MSTDSGENIPQERGFRAGLTILQSFVLSGCVTVLVPILMFGALVVVLCYAMSGVFQESKSMAEAFTKSDFTLPFDTLGVKVLREGGEHAGTIAVIPVTGEIDGSGSLLAGEGMMYNVCQELRTAAEDEDVKAVLLQIDSPGGSLSASDLMYNEVLRTKNAGKKILVWTPGLLASGGYYIAAAADRVMATPTATIGSIGVIMQHFAITGLMEKVGLSADAIVTGSHKDTGSMFRDMRPEEREYLQKYVDEAFGRFVDIVAQGRGMTQESVRALADGSIFSPQAAVKSGLIDAIGYEEDALNALEEMAEEQQMRVITYTRSPTLMQLFRDAGMGLTNGLGQARSRALSAPKAVLP